MFNTKLVYCVMHHVDIFENNKRNQYDETLKMFKNYKNAHEYIVDMVKKSIEPEFCVQDDWNCYVMYTDNGHYQHIFEIKEFLLN